MPLQYESIVAEHRAVRERAGVFDVSHLGKLRLAGPEAGPALQVALTPDVEALAPGQAKYAVALTDDAGCIDDLFVYRMGDEEWMVVPNAANVTAVAASLRAAGGEPVDEWDRWTILAIQGPRAFDVFEQAFPASGATALKLHEFTTIDVFGEQGVVARTGYTGERGFELYAPTEIAEPAFESVLAAGASPVGLGARDTLRLEMGYALYGHELTLETDPLEAGLSWTIAWHTPFRGRDALIKIKQDGPRRKLVGLRCKEKGVPRQGYALTRQGRTIGELTSGNFSPTLGTGIGLAYVDRSDVPEEGAEVAVQARGRTIGADIVRPPFIKRGT